MKTRRKRGRQRQRMERKKLRRLMTILCSRGLKTVTGTRTHLLSVLIAYNLATKLSNARMKLRTWPVFYAVRTPTPLVSAQKNFALNAIKEATNLGIAKKLIF
jgi:hypothetical protein